MQPAPAPTGENSELEPVIGSIGTEADVRAFQELNEEWIHRYFAMEAADRKTLDDPFGRVIAAGGDILIVRMGAARVGCVALVPTGNGVYELSKMAVAPEQQGRGIGRKLLVAAIERARALGATSLFLGSNTKLASAIHLYESVGFTHVAPDQIGPMPYERADVFMELVLE